MNGILEVMKLTTKDGDVFYNSNHSPDLIAATLKRCPEWQSIELVKMTIAEYSAIPSTNEAAELWRTAPTYEAAEEFRSKAKGR